MEVGEDIKWERQWSAASIVLTASEGPSEQQEEEEIPYVRVQRRNYPRPHVADLALLHSVFSHVPGTKWKES